MGADEPGANRPERRTSATRQELSRVALRPAVERGPAHLRIAAEAGVALRTFHNHFASKGETIMSVGVERATAISGALGHRPVRLRRPLVGRDPADHVHSSAAW